MLATITLTGYSTKQLILLGHSIKYFIGLKFDILTLTRTYAHARTGKHTHARRHTHTHTHTHAHTRYYADTG